MRKISIQEALNIKIDQNASSKEERALLWLIEFHKFFLENNLAQIGDIIPSKKDIARVLKIGTGTVQNAVKYAEDMGFFRSKQCIGTMLDNPNNQKNELKMVTKKDKALIEIKKHLIKHKYEKGEIIPGVLELANEIKTSLNTARLAINELILSGILKKETYKKNTILILNSEVKLTEKEKTVSPDIKNKNLVKILKENIKKHLTQNYKKGDKIPSNMEFSKMFNVSIRTINQAMRELNKEKFILSRRGNYGSIFLNSRANRAGSEKSMFMTKPKGKEEIETSYNYKWEGVFQKIKDYILKNSDTGDKIPSMKEFANMLDVSVTTVKRAVFELSKQGILIAQKGKYGGLFVLEMPIRDDSYQWLAINPNYFEE